MRTFTKEELKALRLSITELLEFIRHVKWKDEPYFYRSLDNMKNNIEIYLYTQNGEARLLCEVLSRDWQAANDRFTGIPSCELIPGNDNVWYLNCKYQELVSVVGRYFLEK